jgi:hypothetical protein
MKARQGRLVGAAGLALVCVLAASVSGCGYDSNGDKRMPSGRIKAHAELLEQQGYAEQAAFLSDGRITAQEHRAAFGQLRDCAEAEGMFLATPSADLMFGDWFILTYGWEPAQGSPVADAERHAAYEACADRYFGTLDEDYQDANSEHLATDLRDGIGLCLTDRGYGVSGEERTVQDFAGRSTNRAAERLEAATECVNAELARLYPGSDATPAP